MNADISWGRMQNVQFLNKIQDLKEMSGLKQLLRIMTSDQGCSWSPQAFSFLILKKLGMVVYPSKCFTIQVRKEMGECFVNCNSTFQLDDLFIHSTHFSRPCYAQVQGHSPAQHSVGGRVDLGMLLRSGCLHANSDCATYSLSNHGGPQFPCL